MVKRLALLLCGALVLAAAPRAAQADENGLKIGDGRLHPYFDLETVYDTAAQLQLNNDGTASGVGDFIFHFRPGIKLDIPSPNLSINLGAALEYLVYAGLSTGTASSLDRLQTECNLDLGILRGSIVSFDLGDHLTRSNQTTDVGLPFGALSLYNDARAAITIAPGGGSLTISPGYHFMVEGFSALGNITNTSGNSAVPSDLSALNYIQHRITLENRWRFLPKTAVLLDGEYNIRNYNSDVGTAGTGNVNINYVKATTGVTGLVTPHFSTVLRLGWAVDTAAGSFNSIIGQLEGTYLANETSQVRLGFLRNFEPVSFPYVSYEDDRGYLQGRLGAFGRLTVNAQVMVDYLGFRGGQARNDLVFTAGAGADFEVTRWFIVSAGDSFTTRASDLKGDPIDAGLNLSSDQVYLRLTFIY
ncbi:MAG: outer membrane beta-barrel protein [Deltaproteobacteria bacterium]|nr:outer membrane beta-barrel protein [Deltaproteobacteria bacterium]